LSDDVGNEQQKSLCLIAGWLAPPPNLCQRAARAITLFAARDESLLHDLQSKILSSINSLLPGRDRGVSDNHVWSNCWSCARELAFAGPEAAPYQSSCSAGTIKLTPSHPTHSPGQVRASPFVSRSGQWHHVSPSQITSPASVFLAQAQSWMLIRDGQSLHCQNGPECNAISAPR
jgi:hypothetical protein